MRVVLYVCAEASIPPAAEIALEHKQDMLESVVPAMIAVVSELSAKGNVDFGRQVFDTG